MSMAVWSLRDVVDRGIELNHEEAIAIAQELIVSVDADAQAAPPPGPPSLDNIGPPSLDSVCLGPGGLVIYTVCATALAVPEIGALLEAMLPREGTVRVPGALRFTIARALGIVEAPPFGSLGELSAALTRQEQEDRTVVLRDLYARAAATESTGPAADARGLLARRPVAEVRGRDGARRKLEGAERRRARCSTGRERRRRGPSVWDLRRQLREADEDLFRQLNGTRPAPGTVPLVLESRVLSSDGIDATSTRFAAGRRIMGAAVAAALIAFAVGRATVGQIRTSSPVPRTSATWPSATVVRVEAPPPEASPSVRVHPISPTRSPQLERRGSSPAWRTGQQQVSRGGTSSSAEVQALADQILKGRGQPSRPVMGVGLTTWWHSPMSASVADVQTVADQILRARGSATGQR
jgi:hypothetical protein